MPPNDPTHPCCVKPFRIADLEHDTPASPDAPSPDGPARPFRPGELVVDPDAPDTGFGGGGVPVDVVAQARTEARALVAEARAESERVRAVARQEGREEGLAEARAGAVAAAERFETLCRELSAHKETLYREARSQVVELTLVLVEKLLGPLAESAEGAVVRTVERALEILSDRETLTLRVHPDDLSAVVEAKPHLVEIFDGIRNLAVVEDAGIHPGGCQVQTPTAEIDARLEAQLDELAQAVRQAS